MQELVYRVQLANSTPTRQLVTGDLTWKPPQEPIYKINVDGAVFAQLNASSVGVVIRTLEMEAVVLAEGVRFAWKVAM